MANSPWHMQTIWIIKGNLIVWIINGLIFTIFALSGNTVTNLVSSSYFSKITLIETGVSFLVAGAFAFSGSVLPSKAKEYVLKSDEKWSMEKLRKSERTANKYILLAIIIFLESILISFFGA
jgi:hypothetical protein